MDAYSVALQAKGLIVLRDNFAFAAACTALAVLPALLLQGRFASRRLGDRPAKAMVG
jgi:hypothetical protein